jgi:ATP-dependent DNA helicase RecG
MKDLHTVIQQVDDSAQEIADSTLQDVANAIRRIEPTAWIDQARIPVAAGREVLVLETTQLSGSPFTYDGRPYQRIGPTTSRMPAAEFERRLLNRSFGRNRWEEQTAEHYSPDDLDTAAIDRVLNAAVFSGRLEKLPSDHSDALDKLNLRVDGRLVQAAVVLFARNTRPDYPQCEFRMACFQGYA